MNQITRIGMDTSKYIFQLHGVDGSEQVVLRKRLSRKAMLEFFARLSADSGGDRGVRGRSPRGA